MTTKFRQSSIALLFSIMLFSASLLTPAHASTSADFTFRALGGQSVSTESVRGKIVVLAFGASWLPLSRAQVQGVQKLADEYGSRGVVVYWISTDSESSKSKNFATDDQLREFARKHDLRVTVLRDPDATVSKQMSVDQLPAIVILDRQGNPAGAPIGGLDPQGNLAAQLASRLDGLL